MKKLILLLLIFAIGFPVAFTKTTLSYASQEQKIYCMATIDDEFADNKVMVVLTESASKSDKDYGVADFISYGCIGVKDLTGFATEAVQSGVDGDMVNTENYKRVLSLTLNQNSKENVLQVIDSIIEREDVLYAGPDYIMTTSSTSSNDTYATSQWAINSIGLKNCWDFTQGSTEVVVGVMDTGIDGTHPDLSSAIEYSLCRDFTSGQEVAVGCPTDDDGHGTHVAGIIGAVGNNNLGITGVTWNVKLVSLKVFGQKGIGSVSWVGDAINYAERAGIKILNYSGGWYNDQNYNDIAFDTLIETYSGLLICAAGNKERDIDEYPQYPACYTKSNILTVGAIDSGNNRCEFSNYGEDSVDIYAPGENILSTFPEGVCELDVIFYDGTRFCELDPYYRIKIEEGINEGEYTWSDIVEDFYIEFDVYPYKVKQSNHMSDSYHYMRGTSMATPYVAGAAALLLSLNSSLTATQLKAAILNSAETINITLPDETEQSVKKLNAYNAVKYVLTNHYNEEIYVYNTKTYTKNLHSNSPLNSSRVALIKLHLSESDQGTISISSSSLLKAKLYDSDFEVVTDCNVPMTNVSINSKSFSGVYYLLVELADANTYANITVTATGPVHNHTGFWMYYNTSSHRLKCSCGDTVYSAHTVLYSEIENNKARCQGCLALLDLTRDYAEIIRNSYIRKVTLNGSYILPSGIVVLKDEDVEAYMDGSLVFYNENEVPTYV